MSRIEEENESLLIQIKKISTPSKSKVDSLNKGKQLGTSALTPEKVDTSELKLQLELNEQESKILQRKVVELEKANDKLSKDLQNSAEKLESLQKEEAQSITKSKVTSDFPTLVFISDLSILF